MEKMLLLLVLSSTAATAVGSAGEVPCYFIFGDSLVDNGNNNDMMASLARANFPPYGIDFPLGPTGRFTNGLTTVDVIAKLLGFEEYIEPHVSVGDGQKLLKGVNFASAAAGIREETGRQLGNRIYFGGQVENYRSVVQKVAAMLGEEAAAKHLSKCIFTVGMGSNDYLNNYFMPAFYTTAQQFSPKAYARDLIQKYSQQLQILYEYGARKVALTGVGQIGCSPNLLARRSPNGVACVANINSAVRIFNRKLIRLVDQLNSNLLQGANFTYINTYGIFQDIMTNSQANGIKFTTRGCCGVGRNNGVITCLPYEAPCENRNEYLFWDAFHPSQAANVLVARRFFSAQSPSDAYPFDIKRLAQI